MVWYSPWRAGPSSIERNVAPAVAMVLIGTGNRASDPPMALVPSVEVDSGVVMASAWRRLARYHEDCAVPEAQCPHSAVPLATTPVDRVPWPMTVQVVDPRVR